VSSNERWKSLPQTPTFIESGLSKFSIINFTGLVAPPGTPEEIISALQRAASAALEDDAVKKSFAGMGVQAVGDGPKQFNQLIREDLQRWASVIRDKGIKLD
jgi:tripartite-type tricarboxylate transporter receptor subunit TctC